MHKSNIKSLNLNVADSTTFKGLVYTEYWATIENGRFIEDSEAKGKEAKKWVLLNLSDETIGHISPSAPLHNILTTVNEVFGFGDYHPTIQKHHILNFIEFPIAKDP